MIHLATALLFLLGGVAPEDLKVSEASVTLGQQTARIEIVLVGARPTEGYPPDAFEGCVEARVMIGHEAWVVTNLSDLLGGKTMAFGRSFKLAIADYNHDALPDFNLGQPCGSNNSCFWLFTIDPSGRVDLLPLPSYTKGPGFLWAWGDDSTDLITLTEDGFSSIGYDPACGGFRVHYRWDVALKSFVHAKTVYAEPGRCTP